MTRRADRLFQIIQVLRRGRLTTAKRLAEELEVSERTIYRDIRDLVTSGVPVEGEAGVGYLMKKGYDLPPLMFNREELEALLVGTRMLNSWADPQLAQAADGALQKIMAVLPADLKQRMTASSVFVPHIQPYPVHQITSLRAALAEKRKIFLVYRRADEVTSERVIRPLCLFFWGKTWTLVGWCELRSAFRNFRTDRMQTIRVLTEEFEDEPGRALSDFFATEVPPEVSLEQIRNQGLA